MNREQLDGEEAATDFVQAALEADLDKNLDRTAPEVLLRNTIKT
jgi:hypothetical protein